ncbi:hypothetical protein EVAR_20754_1 [Eumeta japonica]|uniref:Uncharacterized protein n=1 Tax=Eumeta variegata TaxID=151549 RepID=A0A4C1V973_EUMVA|nr:hypothetical protein EVAR_20754_1 [Eumeta japonica]
MALAAAADGAGRALAANSKQHVDLLLTVLISLSDTINFSMSVELNGSSPLILQFEFYKVALLGITVQKNIHTAGEGPRQAACGSSGVKATGEKKLGRRNKLKGGSYWSPGAGRRSCAGAMLRYGKWCSYLTSARPPLAIGRGRVWERVLRLRRSVRVQKFNVLKAAEICFNTAISKENFYQSTTTGLQQRWGYK